MSTLSLNIYHRGFTERDFWWAWDGMTAGHIALMDDAFSMINESNSLWSSLRLLADYYDLPGHNSRHTVNKETHLSYLNGNAKLRFFTLAQDSGVAHSYVLDFIHINENYLNAMSEYLTSAVPRGNSSQRTCVLAELASTIVHETAHAAGFIQGQGEGFAYLAEYYWRYNYLRDTLRRGFLSLDECCVRNQPPSWIPEDYDRSGREDAVRDAICWSAQRFDSDLGIFTWRNCVGGSNCV